MPLYTSVAKLPVTEQAAEIDRRVREEYEKRLQTKLPLTPAHIQMVCGIGKQTYNDWMRGIGTTRLGGEFVHPQTGDNLRKDAETQAAEQERREVLQVWESVCAAMLADTATNADSKSGVTGANFMLERSLGYQRESQSELAALNTGFEALLSRLKIRLATDTEKTPEIAADVALISIPAAGDNDAVAVGEFDNDTV